MSARAEAGGVAAACTLVAVVSLGRAIQVSNGALHPTAVEHLALALFMLVVGVTFSQARGPTFLGRGVLVGLGGLALAFQLSQLASVSPGIYLRGVTFPDFTATLLPFAVLAAGLLADRPWLGRHLHRLAFLAAFWLLGRWLIKAAPEPFIDVYAWTHHALKALGNGENPFVVWMPNLYRHTLWYAPGMADEQWVRTGFPYPPLSLMLSGLGYLFGDMRWANLGLLVLAGASLIWGRGKYGVLAAALLLSTPRVLFVLEQAWTDAYVIGLLALVAFCAARAPRFTAFAFGALVSTKQYMVFLMPLGLLLIPPPWDRKKVLRFVLEAIGAALVINLPWLLWNPKALIASTTVSGHPFRADSLSFLAATAVGGKPTWPLYIQLALMVPAYGLIAWRAARGGAGFALSCALILCVFFSFSKHAFCNHHFLVLGCAAVALGFSLLDHQATTSQSPSFDPKTRVGLT